MIIYGRNPVRRRSPPGAARSGGSGRATAAEWPDAQQVDAERARALCGSDDHQGVCAEVGPYPYADADALLEPDDALVVVLDQIQDPRNLGAVARVAESRGRHRHRHPRAPLGRGHAGRLQDLRRRRRAPADRAGPQRRGLPGRGEEGGGLGLRRRRRTRRSPTTSPTTRAAWCWSWAPRARGCARAWPSACDQLVSLPVLRQGRVAQRLDGGGGDPVRNLAIAPTGLTGLHNSVILARDGGREAALEG